MIKILLPSVFLMVAFLLAQTDITNGYVLNCYYNSTAYKRPGDGTFSVRNIDPHLCSILYYGFFGIDDNGEVMSVDPTFDKPFNTKGNIADTVALKNREKTLKVLASIGNVNGASAKFSKMVSTSASRSKFIKSVLAFVEGNNFDGVDIHWEFPAQSDRANFATFLKELSAALKPKYLLTAAVAGDVNVASKSYDIPSISASVSYLNVMTYGMSYSSPTKTGFYSPTYGNGGNNAETSVQYWLDNGAPTTKVLLGFPTWGRTYTLANQANNKPGDAATGPGEAGPWSQMPGLMSYNEVCVRNWPSGYDNDVSAPYASMRNQWVGYDSTRSFSSKLTLRADKRLGGFFVWSIDGDEFRGACDTTSRQSFQLLRYLSDKTINYNPWGDWK